MWALTHSLLLSPGQCNRSSTPGRERRWPPTLLPAYCCFLRGHEIWGALISHPVSTCRMEAVSQAWHTENTGTQLPLPLLTNWVKFPRWKMRDKKTGAAIPIPLTEQGSHSTERGLTSLSPHLEHWYRIGLLGTGVEGVGKKSTRTESSVHPTSGLTSPGTELGEVQD